MDVFTWWLKPCFNGFLFHVSSARFLANPHPLALVQFKACMICLSLHLLRIHQFLLLRVVQQLLYFPKAHGCSTSSKWSKAVLRYLRSC